MFRNLFFRGDLIFLQNIEIKQVVFFPFFNGWMNKGGEAIQVDRITTLFHF